MTPEIDFKMFNLGTDICTSINAETPIGDIIATEYDDWDDL